MQELDIAYEVLSDIVDNDVVFSEALKKKFQVDTSIRPLRAAVAGLVGCCLRHDILFAYLLTPLTEWSKEDKRYASLLLADAYFYKRFPADAIKAAVSEKITAEKMTALEPILQKAGHPEEFIPANISRSSNQYLSLRYNTPEWVLKIWEHYGFGTTYKVLRKNIRSLDYFVRVRTSRIKTEEVLASPDYKTGPVNDVLLYAGKTPLRRVDLLKENKIFVIKPAIKAVLDAHKVSEPSEAFLFNGNPDDSIIKEFIESYGSTIGLNVGVYDIDKYVGITKMIKGAGLHNVNFFSGDPLAIDSAISRPQDLIVVAPNSSNFDLIREDPDYLLHFKKDSMDELFKKEKDMLEGCSKFLADNGTLVYMISTISVKEGHQTISEFISHHEGFKLVEEKQLFPYEELDSCLYYAVLTKEPMVAKVAPPLIEMANAKQAGEPAASLSEK